MRSIIIFLVVTLSLTACLDPIKFKFEGQTSHLVVFSNFSSKRGEQLVRLSRSVPFDSPYKVYVKNARVYITSGAGELFEFYHRESGAYYANEGVQVIPGETYVLHIEVDGEVYESKPAKAPTLDESVTIQDILMEVDNKPVIIPGEKELRTLEGFMFKANYQDKAGIPNFTRWSYYREYEVDTQPWNFIDYFCPRGCPRPAPKSCCQHCYVTNKEEFFTVSNDRLTDGRLVQNVPIVFMQFYQLMNTRMKLSLYLHNISEEAYIYYKALEAQAESSGTMLDPPPTEVISNMFNVNNAEEQVIGFFEVSTIDEKNFIFTPDMLPIKLEPFIYPDDCRVIIGASVDKPIGFDEGF